MKSFRPGLRTEILLSLTLLLVAAMGLTGFVVMRLWEKDLFDHQTRQAAALIRRIQAAVDAPPAMSAPSPKALKERLERIAGSILPTGLFDQVLIRTHEGAFCLGTLKAAAPVVMSALKKAPGVAVQPGSGVQVSRTQGFLNVTAPLFLDGRPVALVQVPVPVQRVLARLRRSEQLIWFYIALNVLVLVVFGTFLLSRSVVRPIKRLVNRADRLANLDEPFFLPAPPHGNELSRLAVSLNRMVKRLSENKDRMRAQIQSLKEAREVVLRSEQLSCLGRMAAGIAHEVGNLLGAILGYVDLLKPHVQDNTEAQSYVATMEQQICRIRDMIRELLDFSRSRSSKVVPVEVNLVVDQGLAFFSHQKLMAAVELEKDLAPEAGMVLADADQLRQVLINLLFNAVDAMEGRGRIRVESRPGICAQTVPRQNTVEILVSDTGTGIPEADQEKIFDPFFTTKPAGKGTGLGLAVSRRIVESFGGTLTVKSTWGQGSTFIITLKSWQEARDAKDDTQQDHR